MPGASNCTRYFSNDRPMKNYLALIIIFFGVLSCTTKEEKLETAYKKSVQWLWSQQSKDGAWHSKTHNVLEDGKVLTPYILYYLLQVPESVFLKNKSSIERAIQFMEHDLWTGDTLISKNYPNYAAAYALRIYTQNKIDDERQWKLITYLLDQQFIENRGTPPSSMAYGGWGYGETDLKAGEFGHVDISHTRRITEALNEQHYFRMEDYIPGHSYYHPSIDKDTITLSPMNRWKAINIFLQGAQRAPGDHRLYEGCTDRTNIPYDGGFVSSMYTLSTNKCQPYNVNDCYHYPSYATATCDGLLALHALGLQGTKEYADAVGWLKAHQDIDVIDGLSKNDPEQWYQIMHYYHWSVRAEAMTAAHIEGPWKSSLKDALVREQLQDGSYLNPLSGVNKEDDPLMATIFCVQAFTQLVK
jgi:hypothetical protein